jgi:hypothetical protein
MAHGGKQRSALVTKSITLRGWRARGRGLEISSELRKRRKRSERGEIYLRSVLYCTEKTGDFAYRKCMANNNGKKGQARATLDGIEIRNGKKRASSATLNSGANQSGKKRQAKATLASVVKEMDKPRLAASVEREISKKSRPAILETVQN